MSSGVESREEKERQDLPPWTERAEGRFRKVEVFAFAAAAILAMTLVGTWVQVGEDKRLNEKRKVTCIVLYAARDQVLQFQREKGSLPSSLNQLGRLPGTDAWQRALDYTPGSGDSFVLRSLGRDGRIGGDGEDEDLYASDDPYGPDTKRMPFLSFVPIFLSFEFLPLALVAAVFMGLVISALDRRPAIIAKVSACIVTSVLVSYVLTIFYLMSHSGH